jgi:hypothetical protein
MKETVGLKEIYLIVRKRLWLIAAIILVAGVRSDGEREKGRQRLGNNEDTIQGKIEHV